ncbi:MAG: AAA family ATPase [Desulfamplus sp.]
MNNSHYKNLFKAMADPAFYPHSAEEMQEIETHISKVFLVGEYVYKVKKPFNLGFLDFTTLEQRKHFCGQEILLNRRLSCNVYIDVVPITFANGKYALNGVGETVEYAVKMKRLSDKHVMQTLLHENKLADSDLDALARLLASFYSKTSKCEQMDCIEVWEIVKKNCEENFSQTEAFTSELLDNQETLENQIVDGAVCQRQAFTNKILDSRIFQITKSAVISFIFRKQPLFDNRVKDGRIRDCHGDLRTDHIYFIISDKLPSNSDLSSNYSNNSSKNDDVLNHCVSDYKQIQIIDCIEFNERFRLQDTASDLAFLAMDMDYQSFARKTSLLLNYYVKYSDDPGVFILLDFYKCYRAMVRCKVNCFRLNSDDLDAQTMDKIILTARKYLALAYSYALKFARPKIFVICGMQASGKSTIAKELADFMGIKLLRSDVIRKELFKIDPDKSEVTQFEQGIYSKNFTNLTYSKMFLHAQEIVEGGSSVILDATFAKRHLRDEAVTLAQDMKAQIIFIECYADESIIKQRLIKRENTAYVSDARIIHFDQFKNRAEPIDELKESNHIKVDTANSVKDCIKEILSQTYYSTI